ncbi:MAG: ATP synthase F1 subunit delta [Elusimicrobia bacterium]|nr:ATP synthase F1 subunit delta [Elusimicrobiota bacterium]
MQSSDRAVARRYAAAFFQSAGPGAGEKLRQELAEAFRALGPKLDVLRMPTVAPNVKKELAATAAGGVSAQTLSFLKLLIDKKRIGLLPVIVADFGRLLDESAGRLRAQVRAASELSPAELETLAKKLRAFTGKDVVLEIKTDPELLGGAVVRMGDTVLDGSIQGQLKRLAARLIEA